MKLFFSVILLLACGLLLADAMPDFRLPDETGRDITLQSLLERGPVMIDFWADYCKPCKDAMPKLNDLAVKYDTLTVVMISIDAPKNQAKAKSYLKSKGYKFVTLFDCDKSLAKKLGVINPPHSFIMNNTGEIVYSHIGYEPGVESEYEHQIKLLLGLEKEAE